MAIRIENKKVPKPEGDLPEANVFSEIVLTTDAILTQIEERRKNERTSEEIREMSMATRDPMIEARVVRKQAEKRRKKESTE